MARYYSLLIAFDHRLASSFWARHFANHEFKLTRERVFRCQVHEWSSEYGRLFWVNAVPEGVSHGIRGSTWVETSAQLDQVAAQLYHELTNCISYISAIAGWEVADLFLPDPSCSYAQMVIDPPAYSQAGWSGLCLRDEIWEEAGKPDNFHPFHLGHVWCPYQTLSLDGW